MSRTVMVLLASCSLVLSGCFRNGANQTADDAEQLTLYVDNRGFFDVTVYALRSPNTTGARLANVTGGSTKVLRVRRSDLQAGGRLVLRVRAMGTTSEWVSQPLQVSQGIVARLNVYTAANGDMSQSMLIAQTVEMGLELRAKSSELRASSF